MYFYSKEKLEQWADSLNEKYYPERIKSITKFDPYDFLEKLGLDVEWKYISPNRKLLGMIFFADGEWFIWDSGKFKTGDIPHIEKFKKGTIVINNILLENKKDVCKELFVVNHEVAHWVKDKNYFKEHPTDIIHTCSSESFKQTYWNNSMSELDIIERQTNYLNAAILMPRDVIIKEFFKRLRFKNIPEEPIKYEVYMKKVVKQLANEFGLNYNPVLYRLYDLKILKKD